MAAGGANDRSTGVGAIESSVQLLQLGSLPFWTELYCKTTGAGCVCVLCLCTV